MKWTATFRTIWTATLTVCGISLLALTSCTARPSVKLLDADKDITQGYTCDPTPMPDGWYKCQRNDMRGQISLGYLRQLTQDCEQAGK